MAFSWKKFFGLRQTPTNNVDPVRTTWIKLGKKGPIVSAESAMQVAAFYRGLMYISGQIAKLPWDVKDRDLRILEDDTVGLLLSLAPNPEMDAFNFRLQAVQNAIKHGNSYAEIERNGIGKPVALWPLPSSSVTPMRTDGGTGRLIYQVSGNYSSTGKDAFVEPRNIFHIRNLHTNDGIVGQGVVTYGRDILGISLGADMMAKNLFANGGIPSGFIKVKGSLSPEAGKRLKESWNNAHGGEDSGGTAVLEEDATYEPISLEPEVLQFLESRKFGVLEVARFLGIPPTKLYDITAATYSNQEQSNLEVATDTLDIWACNLESQANIKLLNNSYGGKFTEIDLQSLFRGDMKTMGDYYSKMLQNACMTPNEVRQREGKPSYAEGDEFYIAANNLFPVRRQDEIIDANIAKATTPPAAPERDVPSAQLEEAAISFLRK